MQTSVLNDHLKTLMPGLTAKVFRTFNASKTLQEQLDLLTDADDNIPSKLLSYNRANRKVAILCNHQRAAPKNFDKQMENLQVKVNANFYTADIEDCAMFPGSLHNLIFELLFKNMTSIFRLRPVGVE